MIALLDTSHDLDNASSELGVAVEQLLTPLTRYRRQKPDAMFAIDNGAFSGFDERSFLSLLNRESADQKMCRFVVVPDIVGSARRTLEVFEFWRYRLAGWPLALALQDGQENLDIPWTGVSAVFVGGTTNWKLSKAAADCIKTACAVGKWVHAGRVNTPARFEYFESLGVSSIDGTGLSRYTWMREKIFKQFSEPGLFA